MRKAGKRNACGTNGEMHREPVVMSGTCESRQSLHIPHQGAGQTQAHKAHHILAPKSGWMNHVNFYVPKKGTYLGRRRASRSGQTGASGHAYKRTNAVNSTQMCLLARKYTLK
jgi:hypothetical protein